jgi:hypothetical protein
MNDVNDPIKQLTAIPWYDAGTMRALVVAIVGLIGLIAGLFGVDEALFSAKAAQFADSVSTIITLGGVVWALVARSRQPTPPIKLTQASADQHNVENPTTGETNATSPPTVRPADPHDDDDDRLMRHVGP